MKFQGWFQGLSQVFAWTNYMTKRQISGSVDAKGSLWGREMFLKSSQDGVFQTAEIDQSEAFFTKASPWKSKTVKMTVARIS